MSLTGFPVQMETTTPAPQENRHHRPLLFRSHHPRPCAIIPRHPRSVAIRSRHPSLWPSDSTTDARRVDGSVLLCA